METYVGTEWMRHLKRRRHRHRLVSSSKDSIDTRSITVQLQRQLIRGVSRDTINANLRESVSHSTRLNFDAVGATDLTEGDSFLLRKAADGASSQNCGDTPSVAVLTVTDATVDHHMLQR